MPDTHRLPETLSSERQHILDRACWCGPDVEEPFVLHRGQPCERCGKTWFNGTCADTPARRALCARSANEGGRSDG